MSPGSGASGVCEFEDETLAEAPNAADDVTLDLVGSRVDGLQERRTLDPDLLERLPLDMSLERLDIDGKIGIFGQGAAPPPARG